MNEIEKLTLQLERAYREELRYIQNWNRDEVLILSPVYFKIRDITSALISLAGIVEANKIAEKAYQFALKMEEKFEIKS